MRARDGTEHEDKGLAIKDLFTFFARPEDSGLRMGGFKEQAHDA